METRHQGKESSFHQILKERHDPKSLEIHSSDSNIF